MTVQAPEQREFFQAHPLPWGANTRLAQATGYANSTVSAWVTGHSKMPVEAFELVLQILAENYRDVPRVAVENVMRTLRPGNKPAKKQPMPGPPATPPPVVPSTFEELEDMVRRANLSDYQCMQLMRVLAS